MTRTIKPRVVATVATGEPGPAPPQRRSESTGAIGWSLSLSLLAAVSAATGAGEPRTRALLAAAVMAWVCFVVDLFRPARATPTDTSFRRSSLWRRAIIAHPSAVAVGLFLTGSVMASRTLLVTTGDLLSSEPIVVLLGLVVLLQANRLTADPTDPRDPQHLPAVLDRAPWAILLLGSGIVYTAGTAAFGWPVLAISTVVLVAVVGVTHGTRVQRHIADPSVPPPRTRARPATRAVTYSIVAALFLGLFWIGVTRQVDTFNTFAENGHDQTSYLRYARDLRDQPDTIQPQRLQMPVFPYLVSLAPGSEDNPWGGRFKAALQINVVIAFLGLAAIAVWAVRVAGPWAAFASVTLIGFSMFLFLGSWVLADVLGALLFTAWLGVAWRLLERPSALLGAATGALGGVMYLTKAIVLAPMAMLIVLCLLAAIAPRLAVAARDRRGAYLAAAASGLFLFVLTVAPYAANSDRAYGSPTYNVVTDYYLWYDSWEEAEAGTRAAGDQVHAPDLPANEIPTPSKYLREHDAGEIVDRFTSGWGAQWDIAVTGRIWEGYFGYGWTVTLLIATTMAALAVAGQRARMRLRRDRLRVVFLTVTLVSLAATTAWWFPIGSGNRYLLPLWLPGVLLCVWTIHRALAPSIVRLGGQVVRADVAVFAALSVPIAAVSVWNALVLAGSTPGGY